MIRKTTLFLSGTMLGAALVGFMLQPGSLTSTSAAKAASSDTYRQLNLFGDAFKRIRENYVEVPDEQKLIEAAVEGMLSSLDPHSAFLNANAYGDMKVQTRGEFGGLGIEVTMEDGLVKVISPIDDTPAAKAGILAGDRISYIDGEAVMGLSLNDAVKKMRGKINTKILLTILRKEANEPLEIEITRGVIKIQSVRSRAEGDIGYIRVSSFTEQSFTGLEKAIKNLTNDIGEDNLKGFVLDLRNNPGGLLNQSISISDAFLDKGEIVSTRGRDPQQTQRYNARSGDLTKGLPLIVLVNGGSASASEIVAGALQDHRRATIVGTRSFGKGSVQSIIDLGANGAIKLTTARYYTPAGTSIQAKGIVPDIVEVQELPDEFKGKERVTSEAKLRGHLKNGEDEGGGSSSYVPPDPELDVQLQLALKLIRGEITNDAYPADPLRGLATK
ncbi:MAG: peptidase S41 [Hyphomicrobiales bacterium]|nr:MAG: peptidase S41 [Hyphomicrobiales bacterium]